MRDDRFIRGSLPMTKSEVRAVSLSKLELVPGAVLWDVGAGTGSVAVEAARLLGQMRDGTGAHGGAAQEGAAVYAIEKEEEGIRLIRENKARLAPDFKAFHAICGRAPAALKELPAPSHVFIGGSGGALEAVVETVLEKNEKARLVANVATLETLAVCTRVLETFRFTDQEIVQVAAARMEKAGRYHIQKALDPVFVVTMQFPEG